MLLSYIFKILSMCLRCLLSKITKETFISAYPIFSDLDQSFETKKKGKIEIRSHNTIRNFFKEKNLMIDD